MNRRQALLDAEARDARVDIVGTLRWRGLELNTPVWANEMHEYPYLQWQTEVHRAKLKAAYPLAANKIESAPSQGAEDVYARVSRLSVEQGLPSIHPGDALMNLITFDRTWLRPWAFYGIEDEALRNELLAPVSYTHLTLPTIYSV